MLTLVLMISLAAEVSAALEGYVFRETDGGPPRRPLTVELVEQGRVRHRETTRQDGTFRFERARAATYVIRARFGDFVVIEEPVTVKATGRNFSAVMLHKRRAGTQRFGTVTVEQLSTQSDAKLQKKLRKAGELAARGDYAGAARLYEEAAATASQAGVWDALALLYLQLDRREEALRAFESAIEDDPNYLLPYSHLAAIYLETRQYKRLAEVCKRALAIDSRWLTGHAYLAEAQAGLGDFDGAQRSAETAAGLAQSKAPGPHLLMAKIRWALGNCADALNHLERYLELNTSATEMPEIAKTLEILRACRAGQPASPKRP